MKRMAILLSGIHYKTNHQNLYGTISVDFRKFGPNIQERVFGYFAKTCDIDTFVCTNRSPKLEELLEFYKPVRFSVSDGGRNQKLVEVCELMTNYAKESGQTYDYVLWTRFDIRFLKEFTPNVINLSKLNIVSVLEHEDLICDNFYLMPYSYIEQFVKIYKNIEFYAQSNFLPQHFLKSTFEKFFDVQYVWNENKSVHNLTSYSIRK
jgi:hypothetical protein